MEPRHGGQGRSDGPSHVWPPAPSRLVEHAGCPAEGGRGWLDCITAGYYGFVLALTIVVCISASRSLGVGQGVLSAQSTEYAKLRTKQRRRSAPDAPPANCDSLRGKRGAAAPMHPRRLARTLTYRSHPSGTSPGPGPRHCVTAYPGHLYSSVLVMTRPIQATGTGRPRLKPLGAVVKFTMREQVP